MENKQIEKIFEAGQAKLGTADVLLVSYDLNSRDVPILVIGRKNSKDIDIVNVLVGIEAQDTYAKLVDLEHKRTGMKQAINSVYGQKIKKEEENK